MYRNVKPEELRKPSSFFIVKPRKSLRFRPKEDVRDVINSSVEKCVQLTFKTLPLYDTDLFNITATIHWDDAFAPTNGGAYEINGVWFPQITINVTGFRVFDNTTLNEYSHIAGDEVMGSLWGSPWDVVLKATVAHEMAHAYQFFMSKRLEKTEETRFLFPTIHTLKDMTPEQLAESWLGHNIIWQYVYRAFRFNLLGYRHRLCTGT